MSVTAAPTSRLTTIAAWVVAVLLFLGFLGAGFSKLTAQPVMVKEFTTFGYPSWFMYLTGLIEVVSAILVIVPKTARIGAGLLICVMVGAIFSHVTHGQAAMIVAPVVLLVLAAVELQLRGGIRA